MWMVDTVTEYIEAGAEYFTPEPETPLNMVRKTIIKQR